jgi:hypothetical protein
MARDSSRKRRRPADQPGSRGIGRTAVTISANLEEQDAAKARLLARREHRSMSNFVANAVVIFVDLPKDLRDALLELRVGNREGYRQLAREMSALVARHRFDRAAGRIAGQGRFDPALADASEQEIQEAATALTLGR